MREKMNITKKLLNIEKVENYFFLKTDGPEIKIFFMTDDIIRIRASFDGNFREESYALTMTAWEDRFDDLIGADRKRVETVIPEFIETDIGCKFKTASLELVINKTPFGISVKNSDGEKIYSDIPGRSFVKDHLGRTFHYNEIDIDNDLFYGFGEKGGVINKKFRRMRMSPKDAIGHDAEMTDPLYKHIPFYIRMNSKNKNAFGLFYNNTFESTFDMGCERSGYWPRYSYFCADGGDIDLFFVNGPEISKVVDRYTDLTGKTAFSPMCAMGYLGSTMYYVELPENCDDEIVDFIDKNIQEEIPIDGFQFSSGYTVGEVDGLRNVFTWNKKRFHSPEDFFRRMNERGVTVSPNIKPGILTTNPVYKAFDEGDGFIKNSDKNGSYVDNWWGGPGSFVDFTNPKGREIWKEHVKEQIVKKGTTSVWNDNCEYDSIDDKDALCCFDGKEGTAGQLKSIQPLLMAHVGREAIEEVNPNIRHYSINRSGFAGIQRYSQTWAGDNYTSWKTLKYNIPIMLGMGLSGVANNGCDVGGFWGPSPSAELLVRWVQNGIFMPRFSIHSCNTDNTVTEPWMFSGHTQYIRDAIKFRYKLMPYIYSLLYEAHIKGSPIMRPTFYEFQNDENCFDNSFDFMFGPGLLIANVFEKGALTRKVYLPKGSNWYYWYDRSWHEGGTTVEVEVDIDTIPIFIRDNAIIPMTDKLDSISKEDITHLDIIIGDAEKSDFTLFEDDGKTKDYLKEKFMKTNIFVESNDKVRINFQKEGSFKTKVKTIELDVIRKDKGPFWVTVDGKEIKQFLHRDKWEAAEEGWYYSATKGSALIKYNNIETDYKVVVSFDHFDLIGM
jgi:alpha-glucosidase